VAEREAAAALLAESAAARALVTELRLSMSCSMPYRRSRRRRPCGPPFSRWRRGRRNVPGDGWRGLIDALGGWRLAGAVLAASLVLGS